MTGIPALPILFGLALLALISALVVAALGKRDGFRADAAQFPNDGDDRER